MTHAHNHGVPSPARTHERRTWAVAALAAAAGIIELGGGWRSGSTALLAEGLHMGAHVSAFLLAGGAYALARLFAARGKETAAKWAPDVAALINGLLLLGLGSALAWESLHALIHSQRVAFAFAIKLAVFGLVVNLVSAALLHHDQRQETGHGRDMNFRAVYLHVIGDGAVALLAIAGLVLGRATGWRWTDGATGAIGAALVIVLGVQIAFKSTVLLLRELAPKS